MIRWLVNANRSLKRICFCRCFEFYVFLYARKIKLILCMGISFSPFFHSKSQHTEGKKINRSYANKHPFYRNVHDIRGININKSRNHFCACFYEVWLSVSLSSHPVHHMSMTKPDFDRVNALVWFTQENIPTDRKKNGISFLNHYQPHS